MKKFVLTILSFVLLAIANTAYAAPGDVAGRVYETDIKTYIFDEQINAYNIGGETAVICEDLGWYYGFYVDWQADKRRLEIRDEYKRDGYKESVEEYTKRDISQNILNRPSDYFSISAPQYIYHTDIITTFNEQEIRAYNLNGQTAIIAEDLRNYGYDVIWNEDKRTLKIYENFENIPVSTDIGDGFIDGAPSKYNTEIARNTQYKFRLIAEGDEETVEGFTVGEYYYAHMLPLKETFEFFNIKYTFKNNCLTIDTDDAKPFGFEIVEEKTDFMGNNRITYLYVDNVLLNGGSTEIIYTYSGGHFQNTYTATAKAKPYVCNGKVYINDSFIRSLYN